MKIHHTLLISTMLTLAPAAFSLIHAEPTEVAETAEAKEARMQSRLVLVQKMINMTLSILQDQKKSYEDRQEVMENGISKMVDTDWMAKFVLGSGWKSATEEQQARYRNLYRAYLTKMYISNFAQSTDRKIQDMKILGVDNTDPEKFTVKTEVLMSGTKNLKVNYLVQQKPGSNQIIDVVIENVSLLASHRAEFSTMAASKGVDGVITSLEALLKQDKPALQVTVK